MKEQQLEDEVYHVSLLNQNWSLKLYSLSLGAFSFQVRLLCQTCIYQRRWLARCGKSIHVLSRRFPLVNLPLHEISRIYVYHIMYKFNEISLTKT